MVPLLQLKFRNCLRGCLACILLLSSQTWAVAEDPILPPEPPPLAPEEDPLALPPLEAESFQAPEPPPKKKPAPPAFPGPKTLPPTGPYKPLYFDNDFSYKEDPDHEWVFGEELKNIELGECWETPISISTGGELRHRFVHEDNRLRPGGPVDTDYNLWRWRHYVDVRFGDLRVYVEGIEADSFGSIAPDQQIDVDRWDIQNLFVDYKFLEDDLGSHTLRFGRQELLFGRQRLVSPLDWANTRRNFEGLRYMLKGEDYKFDAFVTNPVNSATGYQPVAVYDSRFNQPNYDVWFSGTYFTYTGWENSAFDLYWLFLDTNKIQSATRPGGERHLIGSRYARLFPTDDEGRVWDLDLEGGIQFGDDFNESVLAGFYSHVLGHTWKELPLSPRLAHIFYYGSGDNRAGSGDNNTFNVLFPLGHAYWAISDNLSGQNLINYSAQFDLKPTKKTAITTAFHWLELASGGDRLYNVAGLPVGTPGNGRDVGQALDVYGYYSFNPNFDIQLGYSWFWYGDFIERTTPRGDATQLYIQTSLRY